MRKLVSGACRRKEREGQRLDSLHRHEKHVPLRRHELGAVVERQRRTAESEQSCDNTRPTATARLSALRERQLRWR